MSDARDPNELLAVVGAKLAGLPRRVVFIGGATTGLFITDPAAPEIRATLDVDVIVQVGTYSEYMTDVTRELRDLGAREDTAEDAPRCRWVLDGVLVDVMAPNEQVLGFTNRWYTAALDESKEHKLPDGTIIRITTGPLFVATKIEAFRGRGNGDYCASKDMEDIVTVLDGRPELSVEVNAAEDEVRGFVVEAFSEWLRDPDFSDVVSAHLLGDADSQQRAEIIIARIKAIAEGH